MMSLARVRDVSRVLLAAVTICAAGCGSDSSRGESPASPSVGRLEELLAYLPAGEGEFAWSTTYLLVDVDAAERLSGTERPDKSTATDEDVAHWLLSMSTERLPADSAPVQMDFPLRDVASFPNAAAESLGWSVLDMHRFAHQLSGELTVLDVGATSGSLTTAVGAPQDGVWGRGQEFGTFSFSPENSAITAAWMGLRDGLLASAGNSELIRGFLADGPTRADDARYTAVVRQLDSVNAYMAVVLLPEQFTTEAYRRANTRATAAKVDEWAARQVIPQQFDALGIGSSVVDGEAVTTFVYHHADAARATANAPVIESAFHTGVSVRGDREYSDMFTVVSVVADGDLVVVTLTGFENPVDFLTVSETLVMWE